MALPAVLAILSLIQGQQDNGQAPAVTQEQKYGGYGANSTNVPPGTIRGYDNNTNMYQTAGKVGQQNNVNPYQYRVWDAANGRYQDGGQVPEDRQQQGQGGQNAMGTIESILGLLKSNDSQQQQTYQMPYLRR